MKGRRVKIQVERGSTFTFTSDLPLFGREKFTYVRIVSYYVLVLSQSEIFNKHTFNEIQTG